MSNEQKLIAAQAAEITRLESELRISGRRFDDIKAVLHSTRLSIAVRNAEIALLEASTKMSHDLMESSQRRVDELQAELSALNASYDALFNQSVDTSYALGAELAALRKLGAKYIALGYKSIESPAYTSDEFNTFAEAEADARASGYHITAVEAVLKAENVRQGYLVTKRG